MLLSILGQSSFEIDTTSFETTTTDASIGAGLVIVYLLFLVAIYVVMGFVVSKILKKAGHPNPWAGWVPVYNTWTLFEVAGRPGWWALVGLGGIVPFLGFIASIAALVLSIIATIDLAKSFGKGGAYAVLLILVPIVGYPMLAFGDAQYQGAAGPEGDAFKQNGTGAANNQTPPANPAA